MIDTMFSGEALWFSIPALLGTGIFVLRILMMLLGADAGDGEFGGGDLGDGSGAVADHDSGGAFEILSVQSVSAFLMGFGWVGIGSYLGSNWSAPVSFGTGFFGGVLMVWIMGHTLGAVRGLESSGNVKMSSALGKTGEVYASVPARGQGQGQVRVVISDRERIYNAISSGPELTTRTRVRVAAVNDDNSITVEAV